MKFTFKMVGVLFAALLIHSCSQDANTEVSFEYKEPKGDGVLAETKGIQITYDETVAPIKLEIYEKEREIYELKRSRIKSLLLEKFIKGESDRKDMSVEDYISKKIVKTVSISDKDVDAFIKKENIPEQYVNAGLKGKVRNHLSGMKRREAIEKYLTKKTGGKITSYMREPGAPLYDVKVGDSPFFGKENAKVTIVEFSDFQCPHCAKAASGVVKDLKKKYSNKIKFVFKNMPLPSHRDAPRAAEAGFCANEQGKFWQMHDVMFANPGQLSQEGLVKLAGKVGLDGKKLGACLSSGQFKSKVDQDLAQAKELGIRGTPTFFINGKVLSGRHDLKAFGEMIEKELKAN